MQLRADSRYTFTRHTFVYLFPHPYVSAAILAAVASSSYSRSLAEFVRAHAEVFAYLVHVARCIFISQWSSVVAMLPTLLHFFISQRDLIDRGYYEPRRKENHSLIAVEN